MGLDIQRIPFDDFFSDPALEIDFQRLLISLNKHIGKDIPHSKWIKDDKEFRRVGSYGGYHTFRCCLNYAASGKIYDEPWDDEETFAFNIIKEKVKPSAHGIKYANHFLDTNDCELVFLPVLFENPIELMEVEFASLNASCIALESFAEILLFDLKSEFEIEYTEDLWHPLATVRNISRIFYQFFTDKPNSCVLIW